MQDHEARIDFAKAADLKEIAAISRDEIEYGLGWRYTARTLYRLTRSKSKNVVVARVGGELAGFGIMTYRRDQANLDLLAVKKAFRRRKIGTQIVDWLAKVAVTAGITSIYVQVRKRNPGAVRFYQKLGFTRLEEIRGYYNGVENAVVLARLLRPMHGLAAAAQTPRSPGLRARGNTR